MSSESSESSKEKMLDPGYWILVKGKKRILDLGKS